MRYSIMSLVLCLAFAGAALAESAGTPLILPPMPAWAIPDEPGWKRYDSGLATVKTLTAYAFYERADAAPGERLVVNILACGPGVTQCEPEGIAVDDAAFKKQFTESIAANSFTLVNTVTTKDEVITANIEKEGGVPAIVGKVKGVVSMRFLNDRAGKRYLLIVHGRWPEKRHDEFAKHIDAMIRGIREVDATGK